MRIPTHIMIHHSLTEDGSTVSWAAIEKYHKEVNHWTTIGYHAGVEKVTDGHELNLYKYQALIGRPLDWIAAACPQGNMNVNALHVCCVGNYDVIEPPIEMLDVLLNRIILPWSRLYGIKPDKWVGHRDYNPHKTCPGSKFDLNILRQRAASVK